jgi:very-short-patch-repair endonuclease
VECDGSQHIDNSHDALRDQWLKSQGFAIGRFWNNQVLNERESVVGTIVARCGLPW